MTRVVESGDDGHDLVLMIQYRALKETPADLANIFTVEKGGPTEAYQRWLKTGTVMPEDGVLEARKTAMDAASSFVGEAATLERLYKAINEQYQPRSRVELETDLVDQLKGLGRGASPADVQHRRRVSRARRNG